jgi:hypothetical protein
MTAFNDFSQITFNDGASPPINAANLNALEGVVNLADKELARSASFKLDEYLQYFRKRNTKDIDNFQADSSVYINNDPTGTLSNDSIYSGNAILGEIALKSLIPIATADYFDFAHNIDALNLTEFLDGSVSTTDDFIFIMFYISDIDAYSGGYLYLNIGDTSVASTYEYDFEVDEWLFDTGWNVAWAKKSDFFVWSGSPNWNNIDFWQIQFDYNAGYQNEYAIFQHMQMVRHDPDTSTYFNAFQKYLGTSSGWQNKFSQTFPVWTIVNDIGQEVQKLGIIKLNPANFETPLTQGNHKNGMLIYENVNCFLSKFIFICKEAGELPSITFYIDSTHYAQVYVTGDTLYLSVADGGAPVDTTYAFTNSLDKQEEVIIFFEKQNDTLRAICYKKGEILCICEYELTFTSPGDIYLGVSNNLSLGILTDFAISNSLNQIHLASDTMSMLIRKKEDQLFNSTSLANDNDLYMYLKPNQAYKVSLYLMAGCSDDNTDIKTAWTLTNCEYITLRNVIGPAINSTNVHETEVKLTQYYPSVIASYGLAAAGSRTANIQETFSIISGETGGKIQLQIGQFTSGSTVTVGYLGTYMEITPIKMIK